MYTFELLNLVRNCQDFVTFQSPNNVIRYMISSGSANRDLFYMDEVTGSVYLRTSIIGSGVDQYVVSMLVSCFIVI